jgi:S1-C subfamily serine protease
MKSKPSKNIENGVCRVESIMTEFDVTRPYMELDHEAVSGSAFLVDVPAGMKIGASGSSGSSGFRYLFTNFHVVEGNKTKDVLLYFPKFGKTPIKGRVVRVYPQCDMAILRCPEKPLRGIANLPIRTTPVPKFTDAYALGFPLGCDDVQISQGAISGWEDEFYHMNISINSGNSGGPVIIDDQVVAISMATINGAEAIGLGIPMVFLDDILQMDCIFESLHLEPRSQCSVRGATIMTMHKRDVFSYMGFKKGDIVQKMCMYPVNSFGRVHVDWTDLRVAWTDVNIMRRALRGGDSTVLRGDETITLRWGKIPNTCIPLVRCIYPFYEPIDHVTVGALDIVTFSLNLVAIAHNAITKDLALCALDATHCHEPRIVVSYVDTFSEAYIQDNIQLFDILTHVNEHPVTTLEDLRTLQTQQKRYKRTTSRVKRRKQRAHNRAGTHTYTLNDVIHYVT